MSRKNIIIVSGDKELYRSCRRAFKALLCIEVINYKKSFHDADDPVLYFSDDTSNIIANWLCSVLRNKSRNPIIVAGIEDAALFKKRNPIFEKFPYNHAYMQIPFELQQFRNILDELKCLYDEDIRKHMVKDYCKNYKYEMVTHALKIIANDKTTTLAYFKKVRDYYNGEGNRNKVKFIEGICQEIGIKEDWIDIAIAAKQYLIDNLEEKG